MVVGSALDRETHSQWPSRGLQAWALCLKCKLGSASWRKAGSNTLFSIQADPRRPVSNCICQPAGDSLPCETCLPYLIMQWAMCQATYIVHASTTLGQLGSRSQSSLHADPNRSFLQASRLQKMALCMYVMHADVRLAIPHAIC